MNKNVATDARRGRSNRGLLTVLTDATPCWIAPEPDGTRIVADGAFKTPVGAGGLARERCLRNDDGSAFARR